MFLLLCLIELVYYREKLSTKPALYIEQIVFIFLILRNSNRVTLNDSCQTYIRI